MRYNITEYDKFNIPTKGDVLCFHRGDNNCMDIKVGDTVITDEGEFVVREIERFHRAFHQIDPQVSVLI